MKNHFDISDSIEIPIVDIAGVACMLKSSRIASNAMLSMMFRAYGH